MEITPKMIDDEREAELLAVDLRNRHDDVLYASCDWAFVLGRLRSARAEIARLESAQAGSAPR